MVGIILESDGPPTSPGPGIRSFVNLPQGGGVAELSVAISLAGLARVASPAPADATVREGLGYASYDLAAAAPAASAPAASVG